MDNEGKRKIAVHIMPWAGIKDDVRVGPITFWPWDTHKVSDEDVRKQLLRYFGCFVDRYGQPVKTITICSHGIPDFHILNNRQEYEELRSAIDILIFSTICPQTRLAVCSNNNSMAPPSTDRYQLVGQCFFPPDDENFVIKSGCVTSCDQISKIHFSQPWYVGGSFGTVPDNELVQAFDRVFQTGFPSEVRERLFRSLEWFRLAHTEADHVSELSKVVMMATVFEIFLQVPNNRKKEFIAKKIDDIISDEKILTEIRTEGKNNFKFSKAGCWAWDFYNLRNSIVHGDTIDPSYLGYKGWITHSIVADLVFWELVKRELYAQGCIGERAAKWTQKLQSVAKDESAKINDVFVGWFLGFDDVHEKLGWTPMEATGDEDGI